MSSLSENEFSKQSPKRMTIISSIFLLHSQVEQDCKYLVQLEYQYSRQLELRLRL